MSTLSESACALANGVARTLKPIIIAPDAEAKVTSDSLIAPAAVWMISTRTPSTSIFFNEPESASTEPCTSAFTITGTVFMAFSDIVLNNVSKVTTEPELRTASCARLARSSPAARAVFSSAMTMKRSPACGTSFKPVI